jgi:hypothetical protein
MALSESERASLVARFMAQVEHMPLAALKEFRSEMNRRMAAGRNPLEDVQANYDVLLMLRERIKRMESDHVPTQAELLTKEAERLARAEGVSVEVAKRHIMRKNIRPAPPPEPAEQTRNNPNPEKQDLRPYRMKEAQ